MVEPLLKKQPMQEKELPFLDNLKGFVSFLSFSGNGHSLISSLIDAHKNAIVSREKLVLMRLYNEKLDRAGALRNILRGSSSYTLRNRPHKGSGTSHLVPNQFNGRADPLHIIGDKHGNGTSSYLATKPNFLQDVTKKLGLPIKFIHIYRNPYNVIAHMTKFSKFSTRSSANKVIYRYHVVDKAIKLSISSVLSIKFESLINRPKLTLKQIIEFLDLPVYECYLRNCASIIKPILLSEHNEVSWEGVDMDKIKSLCHSIPYLNSYA